jgi:hypothetical protein
LPAFACKTAIFAYMSRLLQNPVSVSLDFSGEEMAKLKKIQFQQRFARKRGLILAGVFLIGIIPFILGVVNDQIGLIVFGSTVGLLLAIMATGWFVVFLPDKAGVSKHWKKIVLPHLLRSIGVDGEYHTGNDLAPKTFLHSGLFKEHYNTLSREDCFLGAYKHVRFGLYQIAAQRRSIMGYGTGIRDPRSRVLTNIFYGLVLHVPLQKKFSGVWVIPKNRRTDHESDDWLLPVLEYRRKKEGIIVVPSGHSEFDARFSVFCYQPQEAAILLKPWFCSLVFRIQENWGNGLALSFVDQLAALHVGHASPKFDLDPDQDVLPVAPDAQTQTLREFTLLATAIYETAHSANFDAKQYEAFF